MRWNERKVLFLKMNEEELLELNMFLEEGEEVSHGSFLCPSKVDEDWLRENGCTFKNLYDIDLFIIDLIK